MLHLILLSGDFLVSHLFYLIDKDTLSWERSKSLFREHLDEVSRKEDTHLRNKCAFSTCAEKEEFLKHNIDSVSGYYA